MERDVRRRLGENLRAAAERRGLSLRELSRLAGVGEAQVYRAVRGKAWPSPAWLAKVAKALDTTSDDLLSGLDASPNVGTLGVRKVPMDPILKETEFKLRLSPRDRAQLDAVAAAMSLSASGVIRSLVAREARALGIVVEGSPSKKGGRK